MSSAAKRVRVLLIAPSLAITGGHSVQAAKLLSILSEVPEIEMQFFPIDPQPPGWLAWARRLPGIRTALMSVLYFAGLLTRVPRSDVLHVFTAGLSSYTLWTIPALFLSRGFKKKFLMHYHDGQAEQHVTEWRSASPTIALADALIVPSGFLVDTFAKHGIRAEVIPNVVELERFHYRQRGKLRPVFMTNRMLEPLYNVPCILRAFAIVQREYPEASLTIAHDGHSRSMLEALSTELMLRNVRFIGRVAYDQIPALYDEADVYVMTPNIDNVPGSLLECFASGLPAIATKAGGIPYIAENGKNALLVEINDYKAVAACALELLANEALVERLTRAGRDEVEKYHWRPIRNQWVALYGKLAEGSGALAMERAHR